MEFWVTQLFNGVSYGSHYLLGCYVAVTLMAHTGSYAVALLGAALIIAVLGIVEWDRFLKGLSGQELAHWPPRLICSIFDEIEHSSRNHSAHGP